MYTLITNREEIKKAQQAMEHALKRISRGPTLVKLGFQGESRSCEVYYSEELDIWFYFAGLIDGVTQGQNRRRYWNAFGLGEPQENSNHSIVVEINPPEEGLYRRVAGGFVKDNEGTIHLIHRGRIGGGRVGIGKELFSRHYTGDRSQIIEDGAVSSEAYPILGQINSIDFPEKISEFIREVDRIKNLAVQERRLANQDELEDPEPIIETAGSEDLVDDSDVGDIIYSPAASLLAVRGYEIFTAPSKFNEFTGNQDADLLLNDIKNYPHAFILASIMDRQIKAEAAWLIPHVIKEDIGSFDMRDLVERTSEDWQLVFNRHSLHRFNNAMANYFYLAVQKINDDYDGDASKIWAGQSSSGLVVKRMLEFGGVGIKIATMVANILAREFKVQFSNLRGIDISPDVHIRRVFTRLGLIKQTAGTADIINRARALSPAYPGVFDLPTWIVGRKYCFPQKPNCQLCYLNKYCLKKNI